MITLLKLCPSKSHIELTFYSVKKETFLVNIVTIHFLLSLIKTSVFCNIVFTIPVSDGELLNMDIIVSQYWKVIQAESFCR